MEIPVFIKRAAPEKPLTLRQRYSALTPKEKKKPAKPAKPATPHNLAYTTEAYNEILRPHGWECIGEYVNRYTPVAHRCLHCGAERERKPHTMHNHIKRGARCSGCLSLEAKAKAEIERLDAVIKSARRSLERRKAKPITRAAMKTPDGKMSFYVFRDEVTAELKVGISRVVVERLKAHRANSRDGITVLHVIHTTERSARFIERECIISLHPWRSRCGSREWFRYSDWVLFQVEEIMSGEGVAFDRLMPVSTSTPYPAY